MVELTARGIVRDRGKCSRVFACHRGVYRHKRRRVGRQEHAPPRFVAIGAMKVCNGMMKRQRGTTIVELLTAVVCLGVLATAIFSGPFFANNRTKQARWRTAAMVLVQNALDAQRSAAVQGTCAAGTSTTNPAGSGIPFTVTLTTTTTDLTNGLFSVSSTATWTTQLPNGTAQTQTVTASTEVCQNYG
jgi:type II secretory pathway pseudopilin PulG